MKARTECNECSAIVADFRRAILEIESSPELKRQLKAAYDRFTSFLRTDNFESKNIEESLQKYPFRLEFAGRHATPEFPRLMMHDVFRKYWTHRRRTGHKPPMPGSISTIG